MNKILAVASTGGHLMQLLAVVGDFDQFYSVSFATTKKKVKVRGSIKESYALPEASRSSLFKIIWLVIYSGYVVFRESPSIIITTGAAPGLACILWGRVFSINTIWIDSLANSETLSLSGKLAQKFSHITLTQWPELSDGSKVIYRGAVL